MWTYSACNQASYGETRSDQLLQAEHNGRYSISVQLSQNTYEGRPFLLRHPLCQLPCLFLVHYTRVPRVSLTRTPRVPRTYPASRSGVPRVEVAAGRYCTTWTYCTNAKLQYKNLSHLHNPLYYGPLSDGSVQCWLHKTLTSTSVCTERHPASQCTHKLLHPGMMETCHN